MRRRPGAAGLPDRGDPDVARGRRQARDQLTSGSAGIPADATYTQFEDRPQFDEVEALANKYIGLYIRGEIDRLDVAYTQFIIVVAAGGDRPDAAADDHGRTVGQAGPSVRQAKPAAAEAAAPRPRRASASPTSSCPTPRASSRRSCPVSFKVRLFKCFLDAAVSEQIARMVAMGGATENADDMVKSLDPASTTAPASRRSPASSPRSSAAPRLWNKNIHHKSTRKRKILREINGQKLDEPDPRTGKPRQLKSFAEMKDDGTTASGCWIYTGVYPEFDRNRAKERRRTDNPLQPNWGYAWPNNRRILYNRASADPAGRPWSERKKLVWWDAEQKQWIGDDVPDFEPTKDPGYRPPPDAKGMAAIAGNQPFIMKPDGVGWLFAPAVKDGPLPTHYEPLESPLGNVLYPDHPTSPCMRRFAGALNKLASMPTAEYPVVACTFRLTEHYLSGPMSRFNGWLNELQPEMFVELSPELAKERGIEHAGWLTVHSERGTISARAMVTRRMRHLVIDGKSVHQIGLPFHWSFAGETVGGNANDLTSLLADPNVSMHEGKVFLCQVEPGKIDRYPTATKLPMNWPTPERGPRYAAIGPAGGELLAWSVVGRENLSSASSRSRSTGLRPARWAPSSRGC